VQRASRQGDDPGCAGKAKTQAPTRLSPTVEGIKQVSPFGRADALAAIADPPAEVVALESRTDLHFASRGRRLNGVANQRLGQVTERIGIGPRWRFSLFQLALETDASRLAFLSKARQASAKYLRRTAGTGPQRRWAGDKHQVAKNPVRPLRLAEDDSQGSAGLGLLGPPEEQLGSTDDHGQGIVELVPGPRGKLGKGLELVIPDPGFVVVNLLSDRRDDRLQPPLQDPLSGHE